MAQELESVCPLDCPDTCSLAVTVEGGRVVRVDGSKRNPLTAGYICAKVRRYPERIYSDLRLLHPLRRVGGKGDGRFERIGWDEAIGEIADRLRSAIAVGGGDAVLPFHYGGSNGVLGEDAADARFFNRLGACELLKTVCAAPTGTVYEAMYGRMAGVPPEDYTLARGILLWGVNPSATSVHLVPQLRASQRRGAFLAVIDPRRTPLARNADLHLRPLPGTDVVLALALIDEIARLGGVDRPFAEKHIDGLDELLRVAAAHPVERAEEICRVPAAEIRALAKAYAAASPAVVRCGWGVERNRNGGNAVRAILALPAVSGKFGVRGGGVTMSLSRPYPLNRVALSRPDLRVRPGREMNMNLLGRDLLGAEPAVRVLFVYNANPLATVPNQNLVRRGLMREDLFTVVHEQVMTDTARYADIVLPAQTIFEQEELHRSYGHYVLQYSAPVIEPVGEALSNPELFGRLSRAMGFDEPALSPSTEDLLEAALDCDRASLGGADVETVRRQRAIPLRFGGSQSVVQFVNDHPTTASGRIELCPPSLGRLEYRELVSPFPLTLLSPASSRTINSIFGEGGKQASLDLAPADAAARGIADGDLVRVFNELGEVVVRARCTDEVCPGVASLPKGLWARSTRNGSTANALVPDTLTDIGGGACFNDARVEVERLASDSRFAS